MKRSNYHNKKSFLILPFLLFAFLFSSFANDMVQQSNDGEFVVVLDAGHGGHDPGNLGNGYLEKNIALNIVLNVGAILEQTPGIKVIYTRKDDTFIDLYVRGEIANKANADLFVSVHCDSHTSKAHGAGTFVLGLHANKQNFEIAKKENSVIYLEDNYETRYADYDINSPESVIGLTIMQEEFLDQSIALAKNIQSNFSNKLKRKDREVKQAGFIVLHQTFMPSVLVETGFLTNDDEGAYLNSRRGQSEMGTAIAEAIANYKSGFQSDIAQLSGQTSAPAPDPESETYDPYAAAETAKTDDTVSDETLEGAIDKGEMPNMKEVVNGNLDTKKTVENIAKAVPVKELPQAMEAVSTKKEEIMSPIEEAPVEQEVVLASEQATPAEVVKETPKPQVVVQKEVVKKEPPVVKKEPVAVAEKPKGNTKNIIFKVQLMASAKSIALEPRNFKGLDVLSKEDYKQFRRYMYGNTDSYEQAKLLKSKADAKGYPSSYIVAYKGGVRIPTPEAIKLVSE